MAAYSTAAGFDRPVLGVTLTRHAHHLANRWLCSVLLAVSAFAADAWIHKSHYPGAYTEAAAWLSLFTTIGAHF
jgi:hypothetical protein